MDTAISRPELLLVADAVAREKSIDREEVLEAMEQAIQKAGRAKYGHEKDIRATIDRKTGDVRLSRWTEAVETVENEETQIPRPHRAQVPARTSRSASSSGRPAAADRFRPHRGADRQAGDRAARARIRAQEAVRRVQGPRRRDHQRRGQAHRVRQPDGRARPGRGAAAPRRADPARELPQRRPRARLYLRRARGAARAADLPVPHASGVPGQAVRAGSAGDLRRHHRDQGGGARPGQPRQDGGDQPRQLDRPGRRLRRHARQPRAGGGAGAAGREDRHHPWSPQARDLRGERAGPGRGHQGGDGRGGRAGRGGGAGRAAQPGDRPARPERAARQPAHPLGHRHPDRGRGERAPAGGVPPPHRPVRRGAGRGRRDRRAAGDRGLHHDRGAGLRAAGRAGRDRGLRRERGRGADPPRRRPFLRAARRGAEREARRARA